MREQLAKKKQGNGNGQNAKTKATKQKITKPTNEKTNNQRRRTGV